MITDVKDQTVGVAGCGAMGLPMASALIQAGFQVRGFDIRPNSEFGAFAEHMIEDPQIFANEVDVLISVVRDEPQSLDLLFDEQAIFNQASCPKTLIISSTLSPGFIQQVRELLPNEIDLIDAPMSGASMAAEDASLTFMIGGEEASVDRCMPLFEAMGKQIFRPGKLGMGMVSKVMNNYITAATVVATRQALMRASELGADENQLLQVISASSGQNWFASNFREIPWSEEGYDSRNTMGILEKDVKSALAPFIGTESGLDLAILEALSQLKVR
jgi:3-hydroxyisobutyrate dehydrogenase-like beta-hydroxyacid dehydrogenase